MCCNPLLCLQVQSLCWWFVNFTSSLIFQSSIPLPRDTALGEVTIIIWNILRTSSLSSVSFPLPSFSYHAVATVTLLKSILLTTFILNTFQQHLTPIWLKYDSWLAPPPKFLHYLLTTLFTKSPITTSFSKWLTQPFQEVSLSHWIHLLGALQSLPFNFYTSIILFIH